MTRPVISAALIGLTLLAGAGAASAQQAPPPGQEAPQTVPTGPVTPPPDVDRVERVTGFAGSRSPMGVGREGVKVVKPGALVFASFDTNHDGYITKAEIEAGALASFTLADKNKDAVISGFELSDWAQLIGAGADVLSNPMQYDIDVDKQITKQEFTVGLQRLAQTLVRKGATDLTFADLILPLQSQPGGLGGPQAEAVETTPLPGKGRGRN